MQPATLFIIVKDDTLNGKLHGPYFASLNNELKVEECDATTDAIGTAACTKKHLPDFPEHEYTD